MTTSSPRTDHIQAERKGLGTAVLLVGVDGIQTVDGGVRSATNDDVVCGVDAVTSRSILSTQSSSCGSPPAAQLPLCRYAQRNVRAQQARLGACGIDSVVLAPGPDVTGPFGTGLWRRTGCAS